MLRTFIFGCVLLFFHVGLFAGGEKGGSSAGANGKVVLRIGHNAPVEDLRTWAGEEFSRILSEKTGGMYSATVYPAGQLGDSREMLEGLQLGTLDILLEDLGVLQPYGDKASIGLALYVYRDKEHYFKVWKSDIGRQILHDVEEQTGYYVFGLLYRGARNISSKRAVRTVSDMKGLKIRVPNAEVMLEGFRALGASPTPMNFTEVYSSLQRGVIDAQENPLDLIYTSSFYQVAPYIVLTEHVYGSFVFQMWGKTFHSYPEDIQKAINEAAWTVSDEYNERVGKVLDDARSAMENTPGVEIIKLDPAVRKEMARLANEAYSKQEDLYKTIKLIQAQ